MTNFAIIQTSPPYSSLQRPNVLLSSCSKIRNFTHASFERILQLHETTGKTYCSFCVARRVGQAQGTTVECNTHPQVLCFMFFFLCSADRASRYNSCNNQLDAQFFSVYVYFDTLQVSSNHMLIIRRINCINTTSGIFHSMW